MNVIGGKIKKGVGAIGAFFFTLGIAWVWLSGFDLGVSRPALGLVLIGISIACSLLVLSEEESRGNVYLSVFVFLGGGYFLVRAVIGGPIGLAFPDIVLILFLWASYFGVVLGGEKVVKGSVLILVPICIAHVIFVAHQHYWPEDSHLIHGDRRLGARPSGLFGHHNPFAAFSNSGLFIFLFLGIGWAKHRFTKMGALALAAGLAWATWQSGSRGGWLSLVAGGGVAVGFFYLYLRSKKHESAAVVALVGAVAIVIAVCTSWIVVQMKTKDVSLRAQIETEEISVDGGRRLEFASIAFDFITEEPFLGNGSRSFSYKVIDEWDPEILPMWLPNPEFVHNEFLQVLCDYGLVGFLSLFVVLAAISFHGLGEVVGSSTGHRSKFLSAAQLAAFAGLGAILAQCFFSFLIHIPACAAMFGFLAGILSLSSGSERGVVKSATLKLLGFVVGIAVIAVGVILFTSYYQLRDHESEIGSPMTGEESLEFVEKEYRLSKPLLDPAAMAFSGQLAMRFASDFDGLKDPVTAAALRKKALKSFEESLVLNPSNQVSLVAVPQVLTALGRYDEAEERHLISLERLYTRERFLNPTYYAALTSYLRGYQQLREGNVDLAEPILELSIARMKLRNEFPYKTEIPEQEAILKKSLSAWSSYFKGRHLYRHALKVWGQRDAESALTFALAAEREYRLSQEVVSQIHPLWRGQWEHLQGNLKTLRDGRVKPSPISEEQIEQIAAGLESFEVNR